MNMTFKKWVAFGVAMLCSVAAAQTNHVVPFHSQDFETKAFFESVVNSSSVLKQGSNSISTVSAFVTLTQKGILGYSSRLEIQFFTRPLTEKDRTDILGNGARELERSGHAMLVLSLDKDNKVGQADLSCVIPGTTITRTVAWKPEELGRYFSDYKFDGKQLTLKSKGSYSDLDSEQERIKLSWKVDLDLPVSREVKK